MLLLEAVIFDMDNVVVDSEIAYWKAFNSVFRHFGIHVTKKDWFDRFPGTGTTYIVAANFAEHNIKPKEGIGYWIVRWNRGYQKLIRENGIKLTRGFSRFNKEINKSGIKKIIASGGNTVSIRLALKMLGLEKQFDIVSSDDVKEGKPSPALFFAAAKRLDVKPSGCIVFEDSRIGIRAAKRANMRCIALATTNKKSILRSENPDLIIDDFTEITPKDLNTLFSQEAKTQA
ncbi:MAG: HAD family phosphatase [Candidatus Aenigmarchaeota archaeon]|nr:HAD family phosphatase [Candidatus Aenigmarchaeota archaeon]